jgi:hypothetical protein
MKIPHTIALERVSKNGAATKFHAQLMGAGAIGKNGKFLFYSI